MNCNDFEATAGDLSRCHLMDASQRECALAHAASCAGCASRLADERALTGGLRFVAKATDEQAPVRVEAALLAAFRQQRAALPAVAPMRTARPRWLYAAAGIAAIALIVVLLALVASRTRDSQQPGPLKAANPGPAVTDEPRSVAPQPQPLPSLEKRVVTVQSTDQRRRPADRIRNAGRSRPSVDDFNKPASSTEIATDFIPLMNRESLAQMDGGQVMRVELPRSALMSFGLPMDMERATERIKADVVVGNDGLARAIRFVR
jgi:hypothetical protein